MSQKIQIISLSSVFNEVSTISRPCEYVVTHNVSGT